MFIHTVYFWLKPELTGGEVTKFWRGVGSLRTIQSVKHGWIGKPAKTDRPIIDKSYTCALVTVFDDEKGHDAYQVHPVHDEFRRECANFWSKIIIYDSVTEA